MIQKVKIKALSDSDDYSVVLAVNTQIFEAMISLAPFELEEGKEYLAEIAFDIFDDFDLFISEKDERQIIHTEAYAYELTGKLINKDTLDVGFPVSSEWLEDFAHLIGQTVTCSIDRLEVNFISEV